MEDEEVKDFLKKKVKVFLKNNFIYTGYIIEVENGSVKFLDKFGNDVLINVDDIVSISSLDGGKDGEHG